MIHVLATALIWLCVSAGQASAAAYTVKASGGDYTTISACAAAAVAGDTCYVYPGKYAGWTQTTNGSAGNPISFVAVCCDPVIITSVVTVTNVSYMTIKGFRFEIAIKGIFGNNPGGVSTSNIKIQRNTFAWQADTSTAAAIEIYGSNILIEDNESFFGGSDFVDIGGANNVIRRNYLHDVNVVRSGEHPDFVQAQGTVEPSLTRSLMEDNVFRNCTDSTGQCHLLILRTGATTPSQGFIARYNYANNIDGSPFTLSGPGDTVQNARVYNNSAVWGWETPPAENVWCGSSYNNGAGIGIYKNNLCLGFQQGGWYPYSDENVTTGSYRNNGNLVWTPGYTGTWPSPYTQEATYSVLNNQDPKIIDGKSSGQVFSSSITIGGGAALTTVAGSDTGTGTSLKVVDANYFQPGWAGVDADWIKVGTAAPVQITAIDYATNTITISASISRASGNAVHLYKNSSGFLVLPGTAPNVGSHPYR